MDPHHCDVVVVGAGPAGVAAALTLARAGRAVTLVDKARFPRDKCCGDGLTTGALRRYEALGLDPATVSSWQPVTTCRIRTPNGAELTLDLPRDGLYVAAARRADLDGAFLDVARREGITVVEGAAVEAVTPSPAGTVAVHLADGSVVRAWYVLAADGMWSPVRKLTGAAEPGYLGEWHAARQYVRRVGTAATDMWVWFEPDLLPGYAWSFPLPNGSANVGYGVVRKSGEAAVSSKRQLDEILARPHVTDVLGADVAVEPPLKAWPIPGRVGDASLDAMGGRVLFAGDAARAADPMTGEGIAQALETGELAGRAIAAAGPECPQRAAAAYRRQVRAGLVVDDRMARRLSRVLARPRGANGSVAIAGASAWTRRNFGRWMFEDYPRAVLVTPHRWRRGMLRRAGAYQTR